MSDYWLSILIPVYNTSAYIDACLRSIIRQIDSKVEVIVLDDCSTDDSYKKLQDIRKQWFPALKIIQHSNNRGLSASRNSLLEQATGDYIWFIDSDDYVQKDAVLHLKELVCTTSLDCVIFDYLKFYDAQEFGEGSHASKQICTFRGASNRVLTDQAVLFDATFKSRRFQAWARIIRREIWLKAAKFPLGRYFEDVFTIPRVQLQIRSFYYLPKALVAYRDRQESIVNTPSIEKIQDLMEGPFGIIKEWESENGVISKNSYLNYCHFCAIAYINATKMLIQSGLDSKENYVLINACLERNIDNGISGLLFAYLKNFRPLAALRFYKFYRRSQN